MSKINPCSLNTVSLFSVSLDQLIPQDHPKRILFDKLPWDDLVKISRQAYKSDFWKDKPNARVMIGLFVYHSVLGNRTYREVAEDFSFNSFCAYACGFKDVALRTIDHSTLIKFEQHLGSENIWKIKDIIEKIAVNNQPPNTRSRHTNDSTIFESNITYPTDTKLLFKTITFSINDIIKPFQNEVGQNHRHYGRVSRIEYLNFAKNRNVSKKEIKQAKKKLLQFSKRNLEQAREVIQALDQKLENGTLELSGKLNQKTFKRLKSKLRIAEEIYQQQLKFYKGEKIKHRIVSFHRPSVRPIFRGKARQKTEFGVKATLSLSGKALILGKTSYNNYYDGHGLQETVDQTKKKKYPIKEIIGDKGNQGCCRYLKKLNIVNGLERKGKRIKDPPIPKKRFVRARNRMEGAIGVLKGVFIKSKLRAQTDFGDFKEICKACVGYNLKYALVKA